MPETYAKIHNYLKEVRKRIVIKHSMSNLLIGLCTALLLGVLITLVSRIIPIYEFYKIWAYIGIPIIILSLISVVSFVPNQKELAKLVDSFGLKERVATLLQIEGEESVYKEPLIKDTVKCLEQLDFKEKIRIMPHKILITSLVVISIVFVVAIIFPNPMKAVAKQLHDIDEIKKEQQKKVEKAEKRIKEKSQLTAQQKKELLAKLAELKKELNLALDKKELKKAMEKSALKLGQKLDKKSVSDLKNLAEKLEKNMDTKDLAKALKSGKSKDIKKKFDELKKKIKDMDEKTKKDLKKTLSNAKSGVNNSELKESLDGLSDAVESGNESAINKSVDNLSGAVNKSTSKESMNKTLQELQEDLLDKEELENLQSQLENGEQAQSNGQGEGQGGEGQGTEDGQNGNGTGQGNGNESPGNQGNSGQSGAPGGSGAGNGSSNANGGVTPYGQGGIANKAPSTGKEKEYEKIFTPSRLGGKGEKSLLTGKNNGNAGKSESTITDDPNATLGELKPYNKVVGEYSKKAMESVGKSTIPSGMEDVVKGYFSSLQD